MVGESETSSRGSEPHSEAGASLGEYVVEFESETNMPCAVAQLFCQITQNIGRVNHVYQESFSIRSTVGSTGFISASESACSTL